MYSAQKNLLERYPDAKNDNVVFNDIFDKCNIVSFSEDETSDENRDLGKSLNATERNAGLIQLYATRGGAWYCSW